MPDSIPGSSKIFTLATATFLFILVGVLHLYQFAMVPEVCFTVPQEEEVHSSS